MRAELSGIIVWKCFYHLPFSLLIRAKEKKLAITDGEDTYGGRYVLGSATGQEMTAYQCCLRSLAYIIAPVTVPLPIAFAQYVHRRHPPFFYPCMPLFATIHEPILKIMQAGKFSGPLDKVLSDNARPGARNKASCHSIGYRVAAVLRVKGVTILAFDECFPFFGEHKTTLFSA